MAYTGSTLGSAPNILGILEGSVSLVLSFLICEMDLNRPAFLYYEVLKKLMQGMLVKAQHCLCEDEELLLCHPKLVPWHPLCWQG